MESIPELRRICQSTRPSIFEDFLSKWYYKVAIYFTWICLQCRMSANQVTVLSGVVTILGAGLLASSNTWLVLCGVICFHLFAILDMSDGEVARYRKQGGVAGHYLDWYMHFISSTSMMVGLFMASVESLTSPWLIIVGLIAVIMPILDKSVMTAGWTVISWTKLRDKQNRKTKPYDEVEIDSLKNANLMRPKWLRRFIFIFLAPLQDHWVPLALLILVFVDLFFDFLGLNFIDFRLWWLLYVGILGPFYLYFRVRRMVLTNVLVDGYHRLNTSSREIKLPEDDFF